MYSFKYNYNITIKGLEYQNKIFSFCQDRDAAVIMLSLIRKQKIKNEL